MREVKITEVFQLFVDWSNQSSNEGPLLTEDEYFFLENLSNRILLERKVNNTLEPVLIGHLNKYWGEVGYHKLEPGHPVYELNGIYQVEEDPLDEKKPKRIVKFYKENLEKAIDKI